MLSKPILHLLLVRHGSTTWNGSGRCLGQTDIPLSDEGRIAAQQLSEAINLNNIPIMYTSPALRTIETAQILAKNWQVPIVPHASLLEIKWPQDWEGRTWSEIAEQCIDSYQAFTNNPTHFSLGESESLFQVQARMVDFYQEILTRHQGKTILVVGHGCAFQTLLCYLMGVELRSVWPFDLRPASISEIIIYPDSGPTLVKLSYTPQYMSSKLLSRAEEIQ
jgi:broad specificity phosphatase PhoE